MHANWNAWIKLYETVNQFGEDYIVGVVPRAPAGLDNHWRAGLARRFHDGEALLHIGDIEGGHAVTMLSGVVEKLPKSYTRHGSEFPPVKYI